MKSEEKLYEIYKEYLPDYKAYRKKRGPLEFGPWLAVFDIVDTKDNNDLLDELFGLTKEEGDELIVPEFQMTKRQFLLSDANAVEHSRAPLAPCEYLSLEEQGYHYDEKGNLIDKDGDVCFPDDGSKVKGFRETLQALSPVFSQALQE